jgi:hypothetical protein
MPSTFTAKKLVESTEVVYGFLRDERVVRV